MKHIVDIIGQPIDFDYDKLWSQNTKFRALITNEVAATFQILDWLSSVRAESADGCWEFISHGLFSSKMSVCICDAETNIAMVEGHYDTLRLADGRAFVMDVNNWATKAEISTRQGEKLIYADKPWFKPLRLLVTPTAMSMPELPWMVLLALHISVIYNMM